MRRFFHIICVLAFLAFGPLFVGCDEPEINPANYGTLLNSPTEVEESNELIPIPDIEGINTDHLPKRN